MPSLASDPFDVSYLRLQEVAKMAPYFLTLSERYHGSVKSPRMAETH